MPEQWRTSLLDSVYVGCCAPCAMGDVAQWSGRSCGLWTMLGMLFPCCVATHLRGVVRERQNISGNCCGDCMAATCCFPCVTEQMYVECQASKHDERKKQKHMEAMFDQQQRMSPMAMGAPTVVYGPPSPPPMHYVASPPPMANYAGPVVQPVAVQPMAVAVASKEEISAPPAPKAAY